MTSLKNINWVLGDVQTSTKGVKSAPLFDTKGNPITQQLTEVTAPLTAPFCSSAFNDPEAQRHNICFRCTPELESRVSSIDKFMAEYIKSNATRLFKGKPMSYKPLLSIKEDYPALIRCKMNISGHRACKCWTPSFARRGLPEDLRDCNVVPRVLFKSLWIMGSECGLTVEVMDLWCDEIDEECPFLTENHSINKCLRDQRK